MTEERELWEEALAIIDDNLQIVEGDIIGNRFATASLIVDFTQTQIKKLTIPRFSQRSKLLNVENKDVPFDDYVKRFFKEPKMELIYRSKKNGGMMTERQLINFYKRAMCL